MIFTIYGISGGIVAIAFIFIMHLVVNRNAMYSWLFFLIFSLLGISLFQQASLFARYSGAFFYGLGDGIGYIIVFFMCGGAIKQSKSIKMYRIFCLVFFAQFAVVAALVGKVYSSLFMGQSPLLTFAITVGLCCICFALFPYLQRRVFNEPWTNGLKLADVAEYAPALAETEQLDIKEDLNLSAREQEIFTLLLTDLSRKQIADTLKISIATVNFHSMNIFRKLGINSRVEMLTKYKKSDL
uniref:HTH luxR-type domain-containing protein n=1 Tax=uncultured bacterium contig00053 TaxID=1181537 RepID=A0A806JY53_9BACT|nr:hypothetical protein [uncultured bacterium contig00053]